MEEKETIELVIQIQNGDELAFTKLSSAYLPLLKSLCQKYFPAYKNRVSYDDFMQEAQIALHNAVMKYDAVNKRGAFGAFAKKCVNNWLISYGRYLNSKKRQKGDPKINCDDSLANNSGDSVQDAVVCRELGEKLLTLAEQTLSPYEKRIFQLMYVDGRRIKEISKSIGKSEKSVNNALYRIRSKLRDAVK